jgi:hypothetical protein
MVSPGVSPVNGLYPTYNVNHAAVISPTVSSQQGSLSFKTSTPKDGVSGATVSSNGHNAGPAASSGSYQHWSLEGSQGAAPWHGAIPVGSLQHLTPASDVRHGAAKHHAEGQLGVTSHASQTKCQQQP